MTFEQFHKIGIIPVVMLDDAKEAAPLAKVLYENGLPCAEVTFRTAAAEESINIMTREYPDLLVGAGTVLTIEQADQAINAGAKFIVAPGLNLKIIQHCFEASVHITPSTQTPSQIEQALAFGLKVVKFSPAEPAGGLNMIKAVAAARDYLAYNKIIACGGSWMVKKI